MPRILVVDDKASMRDLIQTALSRAGHEVLTASNATQALEFLKSSQVDLVISDVKMPGLSGLDLLQKAKALQASAQFILVTAFGSIDMAVEAMKLGASDFLTKPFELNVLESKVISALAGMPVPSEAVLDYGPFIGTSEAMKRVYALIERVAPTKSAVLIEGESGTGKELAARAIHWRSDRRERAFVPVSCASLSQTLLESELFGHEKGAFTGAVGDKQGRFEMADQGTLFLDEIGDVGEEVQKKLLRVLQEERFERVGGTQTLHVDVRILAATNKSLTDLTRSGQFREDLYFRLRVIPLRMPPLRERKGDVVRLAEHCLARHAQSLGRPVLALSDEAKIVLDRYAWPGNVRELEHLMLWATTLCDDPVIDDEILSQGLSEGLALSPTVPDLEQGTLTERVDAWERQLMEEALAAEEGNVSSAAKRLGISRTSLQYKMKKHGL